MDLRSVFGVAVVSASVSALTTFLLHQVNGSSKGSEKTISDTAIEAHPPCPWDLCALEMDSSGKIIGYSNGSSEDPKFIPVP
jgi:hypothetical protein